MKIAGRVRAIGDDVDASRLVAIALQAAQGEILVAGANLAAGSAAEEPARLLRDRGVSCIIARSVTVPFFRSAVNAGLPVVTCPAAAASARDGHSIEVDLAAGEVRNLTLEESHRFQPWQGLLLDIVSSGGLVAWRARTSNGERT